LIQRSFAAGIRNYSITGKSSNAAGIDEHGNSDDEGTQPVYDPIKLSEY